MNAWNGNSLGELKRAVDSFDRPTARSLCEGLLAHLTSTDDVFPEDEAKKILGRLRERRWFDLMQSVADGLILSGQASAEVQRQFAQSLIDQGNLTAALAVLRGMLTDDGIDTKNKAEAKGLIGRVYKQMYANAPHPTSHQKRALNEAISTYYAVYQSSPAKHYWHGINAVALKMRAQRDHVAVEATFEPERVAQGILDTLTSTDMNGWEISTAAEACVALGRVDKALEYVRDYLESKLADEFGIASFLRQLKEIWQVDARHPMRALTVALEAVLMKEKRGTGLRFEAGGVREAKGLVEAADVAVGFEKVFGTQGPVTLAWYRRGLELARSVARVGNQFKSTLGTGFLVRAGDFFPNHRTIPNGELLLLTNAHVLGETSPYAARGAGALVRFDEITSKEPLPVKGLVWESRVEELDATFARLDAPPGCAAFPLAPPEEPAFSAAVPRSFFVIGYPAGEELSISLHDNQQVGWKAPRLHYRTPTRPGSSGSPVFDSDWRLVALHHAGSEQMPRLDGQPGYYQANEGIWIHAIAGRTREAL